MKKNFAFLLCVLLLAFVLTACGNDRDATDDATNKDTIDTKDNGVVNDVGDGAEDIIDGAAEGANNVIDGVEDALDPDDNRTDNDGMDNQPKNDDDGNGTTDDQNKNKSGSNNTGSTIEGSTDAQSAA